MVIEESLIPAPEDVACNACAYLQLHIDGSKGFPGMTIKEWRIWLKTDSIIRKGQICRHYKWRENYYDEDIGKRVYDGSEVDIYEIPEIAEICKRLDLYAC